MKLRHATRCIIKPIVDKVIRHDSETPAHGQQVITVCAFIHKVIDDEEKLFLPKRAATKKFLPGVFELPGGHLEFGEDIIRGLKREILEEFGIRIKVGDPFAAFTYINKIKESHSIEVIYFATFIDHLEKILLNPEDHSEYIWLSEREINKIVSDTKNSNDPEIKAIYKGFSLLKGAKHNFG